MPPQSDPPERTTALQTEIARRRAMLAEETDPVMRAALEKTIEGLVLRDKIERQVNTQGGNYFENVENLTVAARDPGEEALNQYLRELRKRCNRLPMSSLGGSEDDPAVTLDQVYTQLDTETPASQIFDDDALTAFAKRYAGSDAALTADQLREAVDETRDATVPAMAALVHCPRLIVLGDPGSGKSALVEQVAAGLAARRLGEPSPIFDRYSDDDLLARIPLIVTLRELAQRINIAELAQCGEARQKQLLLEALRAQIQTDLRDVYRAEGAFDALEARLLQGQGLLIFDGLDEVPESARLAIRQAVFAALSAYAADAQHASRVVITCRKRSFDPSLGFTRFREIVLAPYDSDKIKAFIQAWYTHQTPDLFTSEQAAKRIDDLTTAALGDHAELSPNPMLLTTMAVVHRDNERLPTELVELYDKAIDVLLRRWQKNKDARGKTADEGGVISKPLQDLLTREPARLNRILETIAYRLHSLQSQAGAAAQNSAELSYAELVTLLGEGEFKGDLNLAREFLDYVDQRAGLLIGMGGGADTRPKTYKFPHRTFQEYLAGRRLIWGDIQDQQEMLLKHAGQGDFWSLAARLAGDTLLLSRSDDKQYFALIRELTPIGAPPSVATARALAWAARMAAKAGVERAQAYSERIREREPDFLRGRFLPALLNLLGNPLLPAKERADVGIALAALGDPRHAVLTVDAMELRPIPAGTFWMGSPQEDREGQDRERPRHRQTITHDYKLARYPVTVAQWAEFCAAADGYGKDEWWRGLRMPAEHRKKATKPSFDHANHPAHNVSWYEAVAFCRWLTARWRASGVIGGQEEVRLPTEAEWERAARGRAGEAEAYRARPWGDELDAERANYDETKIGQTSSVGAFPAGETDWGCEDMIGNVFEWTSSIVGRWDQNQFKLVGEKGYPYSALDGREDLSKDEDWSRVVRGGSWYFNSFSARAAYRYGNVPYSRFNFFGFRVLVGVAPVPA